MTRVLIYFIWPIIALNVLIGLNQLFERDFVNGPNKLLIASMLTYMVTSDGWGDRKPKERPPECQTCGATTPDCLCEEWQNQ